MSQEHSSTDTTKGVCGSTPSGDVSRSQSPEGSLNPGHPTPSPSQFTGEGSLQDHFDPPDIRLPAPMILIQHSFTDEGVHAPRDPYGMVNPPELGSEPEEPDLSNLQPYGGTSVEEPPSSSEARPRRPRRAVLQHQESIDRFYRATPPWAPGVDRHPHQQPAAAVLGFDDSPPYQPPYLDKVATDLAAMQDDYVDGDVTAGTVSPDEQNKNNDKRSKEKKKKKKKTKSKGKRRATSPATKDTFKKSRRDGDDEDEDDDQGGNDGWQQSTSYHNGTTTHNYRY